MVILYLTELGSNEVVGITKYGGKMPARARFLHPDAAASYRTDLHPNGMVVSDMFRTPESSLQAIADNRGARAPGYSAHNYGLAIDIDVTAVMRNLKLKGKAALDAWMEDKGWYCHRRDHQREWEEWHYNYLGKGTIISPKVKSTVNYIEARIVQLHGSEFELDSTEMQICLMKLKLYHGDIDGKFGPISRSALAMFQKSVDLAPTGKPDTKTVRTLSYCACERVLVESSTRHN